MKALLWKDLRANRQLLLIGAVLLVMPFAVAGGYDLHRWLRIGELLPLPGVVCQELAFFSLVASLLTVVALAGNAIASERVDRSAEFLAYLPPTRRQILASKFSVAFGACAAVWLINLALIYVVAPWLPSVPWAFRAGKVSELPIIAAIAVLLFGAAWLGSALLDSSAFATAIGLLAPMLLGAVLFCISWSREPAPFDAAWWFNRLAPVLGIACFALGTWYFLRRVEP